MELTAVAQFVASFYRMLGVDATDDALVANGEAQDDVAYQYLTSGCREAQRTMLKLGYAGWRKRSGILVFSGTDDADGGRYASLPSDFLRAVGNQKLSALREANGDRWGTEVTTNEDEYKGDGYYIRGEQLWLTRDAEPPATLYLEYHYTHPVWNAALTTFDFPVDARFLIVAEAANEAKEENFLPGGQEMEQKIERALARAKERVRDIARPTKQARQLRKPPRAGTRY
jgi:hypothetical protein